MMWYGTTELTRDEADLFRHFLKANGIRYEASECYNLIHFTIPIDSDATEMAIAEFLQNEL